VSPLAQPSRDPRASIHAALAAEDLRRRRVLIVSALLFTALIAGVFGFTVRAHGDPGMRLDDLLVTLGGAAALWATLGRGFGAGRWGALVATGLLAAGVLAPADSVTEPHGALGLHCMVIVGLGGAVPFLAASVLSGRSWRRFPNSTWPAVLAWGAAVMLGLGRVCPQCDLLHLAVAHFGGLLVVFAAARGFAYAFAPR